MSKLIVIQNQHQTPVQLIDGKTMQIKATANTQYQLKTKTGKIIKSPKTVKVDDDLWVFDEANTGTNPDVVLSDYYHFYDTAVFADVINTVAQTATQLQINTQVATQLPAELPVATQTAQASTATYTPYVAGSSKMLLGLGGLLAGGVAIASLSKNDAKDDHSTTSATTPPIIPPVTVTPPPVSTPTPPTSTPVTPNIPPTPVPPVPTITTKPVSPINTVNTNAPLTASIDIDPINAINQAQKSSEVVITGSLSVSDPKAKAVISLSLGSLVINPVITVENNRWQTVIDGKILADNDGKHTLTATLNASNGTAQKTATATESYIVDTVLPTGTLTLDKVLGDNLLNANDVRQDTHILTGTVKTDEMLSDLSVIVNNKTYKTTLTNNQYQAVVNTSDLTKDNHVTAKATLSDSAGNTTTLSQSWQYTIDTTPPKAIVQILTVADNDVIELNEQNKEVVIAGRVTGEFQVNDTLVIQHGDSRFYGKILNKQGEFSVKVGANLLANAKEPLVATLTATDVAGNSQQISSAPKTYEVQALPMASDIGVKITSVANDNLINVSEQHKQVIIKGEVTGSDRLPNQSVQIAIGNKTLQVNADSQGKFSLAVAGQELINTPNYMLTASVKGNNNATASDDFVYSVSADVVSSIRLNQIGDNFGVDNHNLDSLVKISGKAVFDDNYADPKNAKLVREVTISIGDKKYSVGVRDGEFSLDIQKSELASLAGKPVSYEFHAETWAYANKDNNPDLETPIIYNIRHPDLSGNQINHLPVKVASVNLDSAYTATNNGVTTIKAVAPTQTLISGVVKGASVGDEIVIHTNHKQIHTKVLANNRFEAHVDNNDIKGDISATLTTKDLSGKVISVSDVQKIAQSLSNEQGVFKSHTGNQKPSDYFLTMNWTKKYDTVKIHGIDKGGNKDGTPSVIKYYFANQNDYKTHDAVQNNEIDQNKVSSYPNDIRQVIKQAYDKIGQYINVKFEETASYDDADVKLFYGNISTSDNPNIQAYVVNSKGANQMDTLWWNSGFKDTKEGFMYTALHEITHILGLDHSSEVFLGELNKEETSEFTYMSYRANVNGGMFVNMQDLRVYDLAYLNYQLGVNAKAFAGNDTYTFKEYNMMSSTADRYIYDGGGVDIFDASKAKDSVTVNLTPGSWIYIGKKSPQFLVDKQVLHKDINSEFGLFYNKPDGYFDKTFYTQVATENTYTKGQAFIGYGTQIEHLIGSDYSDKLTGNNANNHIYGGKGNDSIDGGLGDDYLDGGLGVDKLIGGAGNDIYVVDNTQDTLTEKLNGGNDTVYSVVNYTLPQYVENLSLIGNVAKEAKGNALDNVLVANNIGNTLTGLDGDDTLIGGLGADTLTGGDGRDTFVFNTHLNGTVDKISDFIDMQDKIALDDNIFKSLIAGNSSNIKEFIAYDAKTGILSYDADGVGQGADAIDFANVGTAFDFKADNFTII